MNVPETMNEVLDMSDDEGIKKKTTLLLIFQSFVVVRNVCWKKQQPNSISWIWSLHICYCFTLFCWHIDSLCFYLIFFVYLNHAVRKANAPEILSDAEYLSDVEEGICAFLYCSDI